MNVSRLDQIINQKARSQGKDLATARSEAHEVFMLAARKLLEGELPAAKVEPLNCGGGFIVSANGERALTVTLERSRSSYFGRPRAWRAAGPYIEGGRSRYGDQYIERKDLAELIEVVKPAVRAKSPAELAEDATILAAHRLGLNKDVLSAAFHKFSSRRLLAALAAADEPDAAEVLATAAAEAREAAYDEAARSALRDTWAHYDASLRAKGAA